MVARAAVEPVSWLITMSSARLVRLSPKSDMICPVQMYRKLRLRKRSRRPAGFSFASVVVSFIVFLPEDGVQGSLPARAKGSEALLPYLRRRALLQSEWNGNEIRGEG